MAAFKSRGQKKLDHYSVLAIMWTAVTGFNGHEHVQVVAAATIVLVFSNSTTKQVSGQITLQRFDESSRLRLVYEG